MFKKVMITFLILTKVSILHWVTPQEAPHRWRHSSLVPSSLSVQPPDRLLYDCYSPLETCLKYHHRLDMIFQIQIGLESALKATKMLDTFKKKSFNKNDNFSTIREKSQGEPNEVMEYVNITELPHYMFPVRGKGQWAEPAFSKLRNAGNLEKKWPHKISVFRQLWWSHCHP